MHYPTTWYDSAVGGTNTSADMFFSAGVKFKPSSSPKISFTTVTNSVQKEKELEEIIKTNIM